jgi:hypothetical protein
MINPFKKKAPEPVKQEIPISNKPIVEEGNIVWSGEKSNYPLPYAFTLNGTRYFNYTSLSSIPTYRALAIQTYFKEAQEGLDLVKIKAFNSAIKASANKGNLEDVFKFASWIEESVRHIYHPDIYYKLASIWYLDESENPVYYDYEYNRRKIASWMKGGISAELDFFYSTAIKEWIPDLPSSTEDLEVYLKTLRAIQLNQIQDILAKPYRNQLTKDSLNYLNSQKEILENWNESNDLHFTSITSLSNLGL